MSARRVLVTGASSGIGRALAEEAARLGWATILVGRVGPRLEEVARGLPGTGHEVLVADLSVPEGIGIVASAIRRTADAVDVVVNAAGMGTTAPFPLDSAEAERIMLDVNVRAVLELSQVAAEVMRVRGSGAIVNVSSTAAFWSAGTYAASKAWVLVATQGLANQCRPHGVRVMALVPGFTRTEFHQRSGTDASGVRPWMWLDAAGVAREAFASLAAGKDVCIPGRQYRLLVGMVRHLPPRGRAAVLRRLAPLAPVQTDA
ncbi:MAG: SDR family NAD(P)-dependent oxidoreductase [Actinomycetota bacterium]|nr:SDR family NAD(P)-dependent oxidoreductase [Actinomycetota bacterium]